MDTAHSHLPLFESPLKYPEPVVLVTTTPLPSKLVGADQEQPPWGDSPPPHRREGTVMVTLSERSS